MLRQVKHNGELIGLGVHTMLHIYPIGRIFYLPKHRHYLQINVACDRHSARMLTYEECLAWGSNLGQSAGLADEE